MKKVINNKIFIIGGFVFLLIVISILLSLNNEDTVIADSAPEVKEVEKNSEIIEENFYIDIKGAVKKPGVYKVDKGMIVDDAIKLAGGLTSKANTNNINLSKELYKEMVIYVYSKSEINKLTTKNEIPCTCEVIEVNNCINEESNTTINNTSTNTSNKVNINIASKEELMTLTGIGESKANAIIEYREKSKFETVEDIKNISGIGDAMFDKIKEDITV